MADKLVTNDGIASTLGAARKQLTPRILERVRTEAGVDEGVKRAMYPIAALDGVVKVLSEELFGTRSKDDAMYQLGRMAMKQYGDSMLGKALMPLLKLLGPMKFVKRLPMMFRQTNNYADVKVEITSPTSYVIDHNEVSEIPHYFRGVLQGAAEMLGLKAHQCELVSYDGHRARYRMSWQE